MRRSAIILLCQITTIIDGSSSYKWYNGPKWLVLPKSGVWRLDHGRLEKWHNKQIHNWGPVNERFHKSRYLTSYCRENVNIRIMPRSDWLPCRHLCYSDLLIEFVKSSILMGIQDGEICNGTTGYFVHQFIIYLEQGYRLFWVLTLRGHYLFQSKITAGPKVILEYSHTGPCIVYQDFTSLYHNRNTGPWQILTTRSKVILWWWFQWDQGEFFTSPIHYFVG